MLTEREIFDQMKSQLRSAANDCDMIARFPQSGLSFDRMRKSLKLVEGCCRQAGHWREDARWFPLGVMMEQAHQKARDWLHRPTVHSKKMFTGLAAVLRQMLADLERLETGATGRVGPILPKPREAPLRSRPVSVLLPLAARRPGLVLPPTIQ